MPTQVLLPLKKEKKWDAQLLHKSCGVWTSKTNLKTYKLYCTSNAINVLTEKLLQYLKKKKYHLV